MDRKERYLNELRTLKIEAAKTIDLIKNSENLLRIITASSIDKLKKVYVEEATRILDQIGLEKLEMVNEEESGAGPKIAKGIMGLTSLLTARLHETDSDNRLSTALAQGYRIDETKRAALDEAIEAAERKVEEWISGMRGEEFLKTLKGRRSMRRMLRSRFDEEYRRLYRGWTSS